MRRILSGLVEERGQSLPLFQKEKKSVRGRYAFLVTMLIFLIGILVYCWGFEQNTNTEIEGSSELLVKKGIKQIVLSHGETEAVQQSVAFQTEAPTNGVTSFDIKGCYLEVQTEDQGKHIVSPPIGDVTLVCCQTTQVNSHYYITKL